MEENYVKKGVPNIKDDKTLIEYFVANYPEEEDLDEAIKDIIENEETFRKIRDNAQADLKKAAKRHGGLPPQLLKSIIEEKTKLLRSNPAPQTANSSGAVAGTDGLSKGLNILTNFQTSFFSLGHENEKKYEFLCQLLKNDYPVKSQFQLEDMIRQEDQRLKYFIIRNIKRSAKYQRELDALARFAREYHLSDTFFREEKVSQYKTQDIDKAIQLLFQRKTLDQISQETKIDWLNIENLTYPRQLFKHQGQSLSEKKGYFDFSGEEFSDGFAQQIYLKYACDSESRIKEFNFEFASRQGGFVGPGGRKLISLNEFRSVSLTKKEHMIGSLSKCQSYIELFSILKPLLIAYIQCSLPLEEIADLITKKFQPKRDGPRIGITAQDLFDLVLLESDDSVKALVLERYSYIFPVPILISQYHKKEIYFLYHLAYFIKPCKTILSYGLLRASWNKCGKSALIDEIFSTDFTSNHRGSFDARMGAGNRASYQYQNAARNKHDLGRIDIQMPRNIDSYEDETQWQIIDASRFSDPKIIESFCWKVNVIFVHVFALDLVNIDYERLSEHLQKVIMYQKKVIVFARDIDELDKNQNQQLDDRLKRLEQKDGSKVTFVKIQSILMKEINRLNQFESSDGESFEYCLNRAIQTIKDEVIGLQVPSKQLFDADSLMDIYSLIYDRSSHEKENVLQNDLQLVQKLIDSINRELKLQIKEIEIQWQNQQELVRSRDGEAERQTAVKEDPRETEISKQVSGTDNDYEDDVRQHMISDRILFYFSKYQKYQKYQNEINLAIRDPDPQTEKYAQISEKFEQNRLKSQIIKNRSIKMKKLFDELVPRQRTEATEIFVAKILRHERSLLLVWILTEKLNHESNTNPLWKRFLMNQEIFDKYVQEGFKKLSLNLNLEEMHQILKRSPSFAEYNDYQLSIFDFFREMVLAQFYTSRENDLNNKQSPFKQFSDQQKAQHLNEFQLKLTSAFSSYVESGESFELIDGQYLRIHDEELQVLMQYYISKVKNSSAGKEVRLFVVSQIGKQSVGKSFLFNHMFKTKFLNRSGRCTQGINIAFRNIQSDIIEGSQFEPTDKLLILDTEGLGSMDRAKRLNGKDINFDRCMVLFCLTVSNALIITLKTEIDSETVDILSVCCWALQNLKIHKMSPPQIFFVLNQQADTNKNNYMKSFNNCIDQILENPLQNKEKVKEFIYISEDNFIVLPSAFNQEKRNFEDLYDYSVQRSIIKPQFTEKCQDLGIKIIKSINRDARNKLLTFEEFMKMAGESFRTITAFPELLRYRNVNEYIRNKSLRDKVFDLINLNSIITSDYQKINHKIIVRIHMMDQKLMKNSEDFIQEALQPLDEMFKINSDTLKLQYDEFSSKQEFRDYPEIVKLNRDILINQCIKQFEYFKNIIIDLLNQKYRQKQLKNIQDKVNEQIRKRHLHFLKLDPGLWRRDFDKLWSEVEKNVYKNEKVEDQNNFASFVQLFEEHYHLFKLESMDNHRITKDQIYQRYLHQFYAESANPKETMKVNENYEQSAGVQKVRTAGHLQGFSTDKSPCPTQEFNSQGITQIIIKQLTEEIVNIFQGHSLRTNDANENQISFFEANMSRPSAGNIKNIQGKNSRAPNYLAIESIAEMHAVEPSQNLVKSDRLDRPMEQVQKPMVLRPRQSMPKETHALIQKLIGQKDEEIIWSSEKNGTAVTLAQNLRDFHSKNQPKSIWKRFMDQLDGHLKKVLQQSNQIDRSMFDINFDGQSLIQSDETLKNANSAFRSHDSNNIRQTLAVIQQYIQEIDFELGYMWVNLNTRARMFLNTLAFFYCFECRINRNEQKLNNQSQLKEANKQQFYETFKKQMLNKQREEEEGLTADVMKTNDDFKSLFISQNIVNVIENDSRNIIYNYIVSQIQSVAEVEISNRALVQKINYKVKQRISHEYSEEAMEDTDLGVQYIVNYHGLIDSTFCQRWKSIEDRLYDEAKARYQEEIRISLSQILNIFKYLLGEMRQTLRQHPDVDAQIVQKKQDPEDYYKTNELFEYFYEDAKMQRKSADPASPKKKGKNRASFLDLQLFTAEGQQIQNEEIDSEDQQSKKAKFFDQKLKNKLSKNFEQSCYKDMKVLDQSSLSVGDDADLSVFYASDNSDRGSRDEDRDIKFQKIQDQGKNSLQIYKIPVLYLKWFLDVNCHGNIEVKNQIVQRAEMQESVKVIELSTNLYSLLKEYSYPFFGTVKNHINKDYPTVSEAIFQKLKRAALFDSGSYEVYNLYRFLLTLVRHLEDASSDINLRFEEFKAMVQPLRMDLQEKSKGCRERCPACNKYCEEALNHMAEGGIQSPHSCSQYGHQFFSMGGRVWSEFTKECILVQCHDARLREFQSILNSAGAKEKWEEFKNRNNDWIWDDGVLGDNEYGLAFMIALHNKCGRQAFDYYSRHQGVSIKWREYQESDNKEMRGLSKGKQICFVIDGTYSMHDDIKRAKQAVLSLTGQDFHKEVAIVIYRDHDYDKVVETWPSNNTFASDMNLVHEFLETVTTNTRGSSKNEAALDGLAAAGDLRWDSATEKDLIVIHICDAQPHGNWPDFGMHHEGSGRAGAHCCCCSPLCKRNWERDVFGKFKELRLQYNQIFTQPENRTWWGMGSQRNPRYNEEFVRVMKQELGQDLCPDTSFTITEKNLVDIKINAIVIKERY